MTYASLFPNIQSPILNPKSPIYNLKCPIVHFIPKRAFWLLVVYWFCCVSLADYIIWQEALRLLEVEGRPGQAGRLGARLLGVWGQEGGMDRERLDRARGSVGNMLKHTDTHCHTEILEN